MSNDPRHRGPECKRCGRPTATKAAWNEIREGEGADLCWEQGDCQPRDWHADVVALRTVLADTPENIRIVGAVIEKIEGVRPWDDVASAILAALREHAQRANEKGGRCG